MNSATLSCMRLPQQRACASFGRVSTVRRLLAKATPQVPRQGRFPLRLRAQEESSSDETEGSAESLFAQELKRRGLSEGGGEGSFANKKTSAADILNRAAGKKPAPSFADQPTQSTSDDQLARSRALQSEGLEGFPARAAELLKLGTSFFLSFGPLVGVTIAAVVGTYLIFGSDFVHGGSARGPPAYVEPDYLLSEPTVDRMVPLQSPQTVGDYYN
mmetsp:Transcript_15824/g.34307  ORF Transcript_15824/g.34307 Transcript_15824/m.34307 type:complete len:216 (+) Transcript_15824:159-806(+)|eukprot:CAMPEP_0118934426 /NCGR_PEP_ID=MMETSP1169-20130426/13819_1 /TAXON_ID=36882 /ORGANISM="Pyramimonas obovata, Strain CCMP722" /LENGTH=215 /DNA_ID=CAMNT_0006877329 /DNA_START=128 /DNA_END=775 /DNA_ORIENTATION=+